jgi:hypothetical protein
MMFFFLVGITGCRRNKLNAENQILFSFYTSNFM